MKISLLDLEKGQLISKNTIKVGTGNYLCSFLLALYILLLLLLLLDTVLSIEVSPTDSNLLAIASYDKSVKVYDKRISKIVRTFDHIHKGKKRTPFVPNCYSKILEYINCVRWNIAGDKLATASADQKVKVLDFASEKVYYTGSIIDSGKIDLYIINFVFTFSIYRYFEFSMLHLNRAKEENKCFSI